MQAMRSICLNDFGAISRDGLGDVGVGVRTHLGSSGCENVS